MEKKCYKCGSANVAKVVPASAISIPEVKKDIEEGRAVVSCCSAGKASGGLYRCKDCNFEWDHYYELGVQQREMANTGKDGIEDKGKVSKKKWWRF